MNAQRQITFLSAVVLIAADLAAQISQAPAVEPTTVTKSEWSFLFTASGYIIPHDRSYASPTFAADRAKLHLEARYNYEDKETGSLWAGYNVEVGKNVVFKVTPMLGGVLGTTAGISPGYKLSLAWKAFELTSDGEYVFDTRYRNSSFFYNWNELIYLPADWVHTGMVSQRTRAYHTALDVQRGVLLGFSHNHVGFTTYVFNAGWTDPTVVLSLAYEF